MSGLSRRLVRIEAALGADRVRPALARIHARHACALAELGDEAPPAEIIEMLAADNEALAIADEKLVRAAGIAIGILAHEEALQLMGIERA